MGGEQQNPKIQAVSLLQFGWKLWGDWRFITLALRLPRPPSKVEVVPQSQLACHCIGAPWFNGTWWLQHLEFLSFFCRKPWNLGIKATPASNPTLQRPRYSEVRRTHDEHEHDTKYKIPWLKQVDASKQKCGFAVMRGNVFFLRSTSQTPRQADAVIEPESLLVATRTSGLKLG